MSTVLEVCLQKKRSLLEQDHLEYVEVFITSGLMKNCTPFLSNETGLEYILKLYACPPALPEGADTDMMLLDKKSNPGLPSMYLEVLLHGSCGC